ncbi:MAG: RDD family protein [Thermodesulfobacteriota bacterium]
MPTTPQANDGPPAPASLTARAMAFVIDAALLLSLYLGSLLALTSLPATTGGVADPAVLLLLGTIALLFLVAGPVALPACYFPILHASCGQTLGKIFLGIRVSGPTGPLSIGAAFLRWCALPLSLLPLGAGFLWALGNERRACWHDLLADSTVIEDR